MHCCEAEERIAGHVALAKGWLKERLRSVGRLCAHRQCATNGVRTQVGTRVLECAQQVRQQQAGYICERASAHALLQVRQ